MTRINSFYDIDIFHGNVQNSLYISWLTTTKMAKKIEKNSADKNASSRYVDVRQISTFVE